MDCCRGGAEKGISFPTLSLRANFFLILILIFFFFDESHITGENIAKSFSPPVRSEKQGKALILLALTVYI